jgi:hypothetical protein
VGCSRAVLAAFKARYSLARRSGSEARLSGGLDTKVSTSVSSSDGDSRDMAKLNDVGNDLYVNTMANLWDVGHCLKYRGIYGPLLVGVAVPGVWMWEGLHQRGTAHRPSYQILPSAITWSTVGLALDLGLTAPSQLSGYCFADACTCNVI